MKQFLTAAVLSLALGTGANAATQDFDSFTESDVITGLDLGGFSITAGSDSVSILNSGNFFGTGNFIQTDPFSNDNPFRADFSVAGVSSVSIGLGDNNADEDNLFVNAYDALDNLLDSTSLFNPAANVGFETLSVFGSDIAYVVFGGTGQDGKYNVYADNFSFEVAAVPLPAGGLLLLGGLGAFGALRRRKKS